jgi:bifunctional DNA-binding transcriptional regulator/antitoxin component of YhaV-PrlF toxin-antitoxin module
MKIVFDTSTLILLAKIELLREIAGNVKIIIPEKVRVESLLKEGIDAILISTLIKEKKIEIKKAGDVEAVRKIQRDFRIEAGEAEALWLARKIECPIAVDDGPTIKACKVIGQKFTTAIHFLLNLALQNRLELPIAMAKLEKLNLYGRYSKKIIEDATKRLKGGN